MITFFLLKLQKKDKMSFSSEIEHIYINANEIPYMPSIFDSVERGQLISSNDYEHVREQLVAEYLFK